MRVGLVSAVLLAALWNSGAYADGHAFMTRGQAVRVTARVATQGLGYSVLHQIQNPVPHANRVLAVCAIDESFAATYCPTAQYEAYCPSARIVCR